MRSDRTIAYVLVVIAVVAAVTVWFFGGAR